MGDMPALTEKEMLREIKSAGCSVKRTAKGHYLVLDSLGNVIESFAVGHGANKGMVNAPYVSKVRKALAQV